MQILKLLRMTVDQNATNRLSPFMGAGPGLSGGPDHDTCREPAPVLDAPSRHDIIAYLQKVGEEHEAKANVPASVPEY